MIINLSTFSIIWQVLPNLDNRAGPKFLYQHSFHWNNPELSKWWCYLYLDMRIPVLEIGLNAQSAQKHMLMKADFESINAKFKNKNPEFLVKLLGNLIPVCIYIYAWVDLTSFCFASSIFFCEIVVCSCQMVSISCQ